MSTVAPGQDLVWKHVPRLARLLTDYLDAAREDRRKQGAAFQWIDRAGPKTAAYATLAAVVDFFPAPRKLRWAAESVAERLRDECQRPPEYARGERGKVGGALVGMLVPWLVTIEKIGGTNHIVPTDEAAEFLSQRTEARKYEWPLWAPMIVPPRPWGSSDGQGGYRFSLRGRLAFVHGASEVEDSAPSLRIRKAVDAIQATPWRIDRDMLQLAREIVDGGGGELGLPTFRDYGSANEVGPGHPDLEEPEWLRDLMPTEEWVKQQKEEAERERVKKALAVAEELVGEDVYFPHYLDWRGRIYAVPGAGLLHVEDPDGKLGGGVLNPQAGDLARALLRFRDGKSLGSDGARYLALHGANCYGGELAQMSKAERVAWIEDRTPEIEATAREPRTSELATAAADPLQFCAFAREWAAYAAHKRQGEGGETFVSNLPIGQDGTCNGVQHFAALWRDGETGERVNLLPSTWGDTPNDFYSDVAGAARRRLEALTGEGDEQAKRWAPFAAELFTRETAKLPAMTFSYGATKKGLQTRAWRLLKDVSEDPRNVFGTVGESDPERVSVTDGDSSFLAGILFDAVREVAPALAQGRDWLQGERGKGIDSVAGAFCDRNRPVSWRVEATGFQVIQDGRPYWESNESTRAEVRDVQGAILATFSDYRRTDQVRESKQRSGVAANLIHSLDAAALVLAVERAHDRYGVQSIGVVHDCYHTPAGDAAAVARSAREAFVELHEGNVLQDLSTQFSIKAGAPAPPAVEGPRLEIRDVLESENFLS